MRVIITGASGFIGRKLLLRLPADWDVVALCNADISFFGFVNNNCLRNVRAEECDFRIEEEVVSLANRLGNRHFDFCIYLAGNSDPSFSVSRPSDDMSSNTLGLINFLSIFQIGKLIYLSSGAVYVGLSGLVSSRSPLLPALPYAISKLACEHYIKFFAEKTTTVESYTILRSFGAYGPYEPPRKIYSRLVTELCIEDRNDFTVHGDGENYIDAMYVDDAVSGLLGAASIEAKNLTLDFCSSIPPMTINQLVRFAAKEFGKPNLSIEHVGNTAEYIRFRSSAPTFAWSLLNMQRPISLSEGLQKLREHLVNQQGGEL